MGVGLVQTERSTGVVQGVQEAGSEPSRFHRRKDFFTLRHLHHLERKEEKFLFCFILFCKTVHEKIYPFKHFLFGWVFFKKLL